MSNWQLWIKEGDSYPKDNVSVLAIIATKDSRAQQHVVYHDSTGWHIQSCCRNCQVYSEQTSFEVGYWMHLPTVPPYAGRDIKKEKEFSHE